MAAIVNKAYCAAPAKEQSQELFKWGVICISALHLFVIIRNQAKFVDKSLFAP